MSDAILRQTVFDLLSDWRGIESLKKLFWSELSYDQTNDPISRAGWPKAAAEALVDSPSIFAQAGDFKILHARLASDRLNLTDERAVVNRLLRDYPYALFIFSNRSQDRWHLVNVKDAAKAAQAQGERRPRLLLRRIALGPEERLRTAAERLAMLDLRTIQPTLFGLPVLEIQRRHDEAFDVEAVTEAFFQDYQQVFAKLQDGLRRAGRDAVWAHDYALQLLNRLMFLYFIQRKRWLGGNAAFLHTFWRAYRDSGQPADTFYTQWLSVLFFEAFNNSFQAGRSDRQHIPEELRRALAIAPYLNGGLFTRNDLDTKHSVALRDELFEILFERYEAHTTGFFERYNFTITEDTPFDQEVAVDPEMIGKVYESLVNITSEGVQETDQRGSAGIFYTPRVEIDLMCRLALLDYLANHLGAARRALLCNAVFAYDPDEKQEADQALAREDLWPQLDALLRTVTVLDPACGSGSFLVGMLAILDDLQARANAQLGEEETPYERRKRIIGQSLYGVDVMPWAVHVAELRLWLQLVVETELHPAELRFRPLLPNLSFKLRVGDSLVQEIGGINFSPRHSQRNIPPVLKGRITQFKGEKLKFYHNDPAARFRTQAQLEQEERQLFRDILEARRRTLQEQWELKRNKAQERRAVQPALLAGTEDGHNTQGVQEAEAEAGALQDELAAIKTAQRALARARQVPFVWDIAFVEVFEGERGGFDIVVGNPPYVRQERIAPPTLREEDFTAEQWLERRREYKEKLQRSVAAAYPRFFGFKPRTGESTRRLDGKSDLYIYFYLHGLSLLNPSGAFCFITSNSWLDVGYGAQLQEFLLKHGHVRLLIDNETRRSFQQADVNTVIALLGTADDARPAGLQNVARFAMFTVPFHEAISPVIFEEIEEAQERLVRPEFRMVAKAQGSLLGEGLISPDDGSDGQQQKIKPGGYAAVKWGGKYLRAPGIYWEVLQRAQGEWAPLASVADVRRGFTTGANEFFYLDEEAVREWAIEPEFLAPALLRPAEIIAPVIRSETLHTWLLVVDKPRRALRGTRVERYIKWGESRGFHRTATCAARAEWYRLTPRPPAPLVLPIINKMRLVLGINCAGAQADHNLVEIRPKDTASIDLMAALMLGSFNFLLRRIEGRSYGRMLKVETCDAGRLLLHDPGKIPASEVKPLLEAFEALREREFQWLVAEMATPEREALDRAWLHIHGFRTAREQDAALEAIREAVQRLSDEMQAQEEDWVRQRPAVRSSGNPQDAMKGRKGARR